MYLNLQERLDERLRSYGIVALAIDGWEDNGKQECLGVTAHALRGEEKVLLLDIERQTERQTAENLGKYLKRVIQRVEDAGCRVIGCVANKHMLFFLGEFER